LGHPLPERAEFLVAVSGVSVSEARQFVGQ
jgi:hypothetical protein